ncbi:DUF4296 domain-containing protein [Flavobacterium alkalisoli]|uniref:Type IV secretion system putative lipoprotein virB7 n=1 Tax=Flavobacterium alkalisoli TaxID=2602769 RepID=A0A5B9FQ07_9FLAO|nr:DUF4296 domain-containing protein [Flavobacterium alkalisoli]QEE49064.1 DUF4296 domain-containing protein [Flavobacterium alkalisoli]
MKKFTVILFALVVLAACNKGPEKPQNFIEEDKMEDILYDVALLQSMSSFAPGVLHDNDITVNDYLYKKYDMDSLTFTENHTYYASDFERYQKLMERVTDRLRAEKTEVDTLMQAKPEKDEIKASALVVDTAKVKEKL